MRFVRGDVSTEADIVAAVGEAANAFGQLDVFFNNPGVGGAFGPITWPSAARSFSAERPGTCISAEDA
jgi:NAD(P)-dependent dehydrogenase (short-subunit alcohol dehydrogenase family)